MVDSWPPAMGVLMAVSTWITSIHELEANDEIEYKASCTRILPIPSSMALPLWVPTMATMGQA